MSCHRTRLPTPYQDDYREAWKSLSERGSQPPASAGLTSANRILIRTWLPKPMWGVPHLCRTFHTIVLNVSEVYTAEQDVARAGMIGVMVSGVHPGASGYL